MIKVEDTVRRILTKRENMKKMSIYCKDKNYKHYESLIGDPTGAFSNLKSFSTKPSLSQNVTYRDVK